MRETLRAMIVADSNRLQQWMYAHTRVYFSFSLSFTQTNIRLYYYFQSEFGELAQKQFYQQLLNHSFNEKAETINKRQEQKMHQLEIRSYILSIVILTHSLCRWHQLLHHHPLSHFPTLLEICFVM